MIYILILLCVLCGSSAMGQTCDASATLTQTVTHNDWWSIGVFNHQQLLNSTSITICRAEIQQTSPSSGTGHVEIWETDESAQIGGDSSTETVSTGGGGAFISYTWSSNKPDPSADFHMRTYEESGTVRDRVNTDNQSYEDENYDFWIDGFDDKNDDLFFTIYIESGEAGFNTFKRRSSDLPVNFLDNDYCDCSEVFYSTIDDENYDWLFKGRADV